MTEQQQQKQRAIDLLESRYRGMENVCEGIDMRLRMYFEDLLEHSSAREVDPQAAAAASGEEDITEGGAGQGGNQGGGTTGGELEG